MLTGELVPVDWHRLPVQVINGPGQSSEFLFARLKLNNIVHIQEGSRNTNECTSFKVMRVTCMF